MGKGKGKKTEESDEDTDEDDNVDELNSEDEHEAGVPVDESLIKVVKRALDKLVEISDNERFFHALRSLSYAKTIAPVEVIGIVLLVHAICCSISSQERLNLLLPRLVLLFRLKSHKDYKRDLRLRVDVGKYMLSVISDMVKDPEGVLKNNENAELLQLAGQLDKTGAGGDSDTASAGRSIGVGMKRKSKSSKSKRVTFRIPQTPESSLPDSVSPGPGRQLRRSNRTRRPKKKAASQGTDPLFTDEDDE
ncbi:hypothetical protein AAF712_006212 [Marasmius tenuissimus]|uniref:Uncharacterized protein n=1 Tax=Marasmius tenuissimus TaxID=585030 RepID=A0ABR3A0G8_9AGAR